MKNVWRWVIAVVLIVLTGALHLTFVNPLPHFVLRMNDHSSSFKSPGHLQVNVDAYDPFNSIVYVEFFGNGEVISTDQTSPYSCVWSDIPEGHHLITAVACNKQGKAIRYTPPVSFIIIK